MVKLFGLKSRQPDLAADTEVSRFPRWRARRHESIIEFARQYATPKIDYFDRISYEKFRLLSILGIRKREEDESRHSTIHLFRNKEKEEDNSPKLYFEIVHTKVREYDPYDYADNVIIRGQIGLDEESHDSPSIITCDVKEQVDQNGTIRQDGEWHRETLSARDARLLESSLFDAFVRL